jgi:hypothetical protein
MADPPDEPIDFHEMQLCFDGRQRRHIRIAALLHALDVWDQIELTDLAAKRSDRPQNVLRPGAYLAGSPADNTTRLQLITKTGEVLTGYALFRKLTRTLRLLWPLALVTWVPGRVSAKTRRQGAQLD